MKYDVLKKTGFLFPKAPCSVVARFLRFIDQQNFLIIEETMLHHSAQQTQTCAPGTCYYIIVMIFHILRRVVGDQMDHIAAEIIQSSVCGEIFFLRRFIG